MSDENLKPDEQLSPTAQAKSEQTGAPKPKKKRNKIIIAGVIVIAVVAAGIGMLVWHEQPSFCSTMCHLEQAYVDNYMQEQGTAGYDKYGQKVSNTNAMMAVLHRNTKATAKSEILCVDCHVPNMMELANDGVHLFTGNYTLPRDERDLAGMKSWDGEPGESFCANENCHVYLLGSDGKLSYDKLSDSTKSREFNPHEQHHANLTLDCSDCHKGHRASTIVCTACHQHENVALPDGWVTYEESQKLLQSGYKNGAAA